MKIGDLPIGSDLTLIFERDDVRNAIVNHCADSDAHLREDGYETCVLCRFTRLVLATAILEWRDIANQDAASRG